MTIVPCLDYAYFVNFYFMITLTCATYLEKLCTLFSLYLEIIFITLF